MIRANAKPKPMAAGTKIGFFGRGRYQLCSFGHRGTLAALDLLG